MTAPLKLVHYAVERIRWRRTYASTVLVPRVYPPPRCNASTPYTPEIEEWLQAARIPILEARAFAYELELHSVDEWRRFCKGELPGMSPKPDDFPASPHKTYKNKGWTRDEWRRFCKGERVKFL